MADHIYYRSTNPGSSKRISTGNPTWDNNLFVSTDPDLSRAYGSSTEVIKAKPDAKIVKEDSKEFRALKVRPRSSERYLDYLTRALVAAKEAGYDIIEFKRQGDVGTVIINPDSVIRNYRPYRPEKTESRVIHLMDHL